MIFVTTDEYLALIQTAIDESDFVGNKNDRWHPEDIHTVFETVARTVRSVLENAPVDRRYEQ